MELIFIMASNKYIDFNVNLASVFENGIDKGFELVDFVSSVNVSCCSTHCSPLAIKDAVKYCKFKSKEMGALISLPNNIENPFELTDDEIEAIVLYQLGAISAFTKAYSLNIEHVRPDGLMYRLCSENFDFASKVALSVKKFSEWFTIYGATGSLLSRIEQECNVNVAHEVIINSVFNCMGENNFDVEEISDNDALFKRFKSIINHKEIDTVDNKLVPVLCDTIHFDVNANNTKSLLEGFNNILSPKPVNYNKVVASGWVE